MKGASLATALNRRIEQMVSDDRSRSEIIGSISSAAGISSGTVNQILNGEIDRPPDNRLRGFSSVLDLGMSRLQSLADSDAGKTIMTLEQLLAAARKAITDGDLEEAEKLTNQAKALKAVNDLTPADATEADEFKALKIELDGLKEFKARIEAEPPTKTAGHVTVVEDEDDKKAKQPWDDLGRFLKAVRSATMYGQLDDRLKSQKGVLGASEGVPADGGFLVQPNFANEIFMLEHADSEVLTRVRRFPVGANNNGLTMNAVDETSRATGSRWGGVQAYWAAEGDTATASKPKFRQMELKLNKLFALMYATDELLADTTQLAAVTRVAVNEELTWKAENAILRGTGAGQPHGILNSNALVTVAKEAGQTADTIVFNNIVKMWSRMWSRSRRNAVWFINQDAEPQLITLADAAGNAIYLPQNNLSTSPFAMLLGRPVVPVEFCSTVGDAGDILLADLSQYITIDKGGIEEASSMHVQFLTDQMAFRWTYRVDGQSGWSSALTPANGTNTLSPFVVLAARA